MNAAITEFSQKNQLSEDQVVTLLDITQAFRVSRKEASSITRNFHSNFNYTSSFLSNEIIEPNTHGGVKNALYMTFQYIAKNFESYPPRFQGYDLTNPSMNAKDFFEEAKKHAPHSSQDPISGYSFSHQADESRGRRRSPRIVDRGVREPVELETMDDQVNEAKKIQQLIGNFLANPNYGNEEMPWGMLFLAQKLDEESFKTCIDYILNDHIWRYDIDMDVFNVPHRDVFIEELRGFKESDFIQKLKDNDENAKNELLTHFRRYEGDGRWMIKLEKGAEIGGMSDFLARFNGFYDGKPLELPVKARLAI